MEKSFEKCQGITEMGIGTRVEIDFIDVLNENEGILVGNTAQGYVRILAECRQTDTYPPRPFRVNAGAIHQYIYVGDNKTKYLADIKAGDSILVTDGVNNRQVTVGRVKIEKREFIRVVFDPITSATLQKADSIFLAGKDGAIHFMDMDDNSYFETYSDIGAARHKGELIDEEITEK